MQNGFNFVILIICSLSKPEYFSLLISVFSGKVVIIDGQNAASEHIKYLLRLTAGPKARLLLETCILITSEASF